MNTFVHTVQTPPSYLVFVYVMYSFVQSYQLNGYEQWTCENAIWIFVVGLEDSKREPWLKGDKYDGD